MLLMRPRWGEGCPWVEIPTESLSVVLVLAPRESPLSHRGRQAGVGGTGFLEQAYLGSSPSGFRMCRLHDLEPEAELVASSLVRGKTPPSRGCRAARM